MKLGCVELGGRSGHLEGDIATEAGYLRAALDGVLFQARQRPIEHQTAVARA